MRIRLNHIRYIFLLASGCTQFSCLPEPLEVRNIPAVKPEIVVNTQIIPDESLVVLLTKTFSALDANGDSDPEDLLAQIAVDDALVILSGVTQTDTLLNLGNGVYGGVFIDFQEGETYQLYVSSESLGVVTAETQVRAPVFFDDVAASLYYTGYDDTLAQVTYTINDPIETNWYMINVQDVSQQEIESNLLNPRAFTWLIEDVNFNGSSFTETILAFPRDYSPGDTIGVSISSISEDYFKFIELRINNRFSFIEYLSEPVNYPSNIKGGKGFFNLYLPDIRTFVLE